MKYEFMSQYPFILKDRDTQVFAIDFLVQKQPDAPTHWTEPKEIEDDWMRLMVLSQAIATPYKEQARIGMRRDPGGYNYWLKNRSSSFLHKRLDDMKAIGLVAPNTIIPPITGFPFGSWAINFPFTLRKPYISRDDTDFYIIDNPVKKEWVFKVPYIAASQWKGALRSAMVRDLVSCLGAGNNDVEKFNEERLRLFRLFGNEKDGTSEFLNRVLARYSQGEDSVGEQADQDKRELFKAEIKRVNEVFKSDLLSKGYRQGDIEGFQGSLHFYPTYFDQIGLEVINPHDRKTGAGKNPIYFECVPEGTKGVFTLLYVLLVGPELNSEKAEEQAKQDLKAAARGVKAMITRYGFGAKTSSGFGVADVGWEEASIRPEDEEFQAYWEEVWREDLA